MNKIYDSITVNFNGTKNRKMILVNNPNDLTSPDMFHIKNNEDMKILNAIDGTISNNQDFGKKYFSKTISFMDKIKDRDNNITHLVEKDILSSKWIFGLTESYAKTLYNHLTYNVKSNDDLLNLKFLFRYFVYVTNIDSGINIGFRYDFDKRITYVHTVDLFVGRLGDIIDIVHDSDSVDLLTYVNNHTAYVKCI